MSRVFGYVSGCLAMGFAPDRTRRRLVSVLQRGRIHRRSTHHRIRCRRVEPGDLVRTEPSRLVLEPSGQLGAIMATGTRVMYRSTDARGNPDVVTGTYFEPLQRLAGQGPAAADRLRPRAPRARATSARRRGSSTRASTGRRIWTSRSTTRSCSSAPWWPADLPILMTDYEGLGTIGVTHTYVNRLSQGHAMLDAARAALRLPDTSLDAGRAGGVLGLLAGRRRGGVGGRTGRQLRTGARHRRYLCRCATGRPGRADSRMPTAARWSGWSATRSTASSQSYPEAEPADPGQADPAR